MIISKTPFRVSLFGGGTDYPAWYKQHGGEVLGFTIDKYCYISLRKLPPFFPEYNHRIVWSKIELVKSYAEIVHPAAREILKAYAPECGIELHHDGDLPARSGLGSSSAFSVGLINALHAFRGQMSSRQTLAQTAIQVEQNVLKENVGNQDQVWAAYGGFNRIHFLANDTFEVRPVIISQERKRLLNRSLMLFFTGISRFSSEISGKQLANFERKKRHLQQMAALVPECLAILQSDTRSLDEIGGLLHEGWRLKRDLAEGVSTDAIDTIYEAARSAGAEGGKVLGAGGGGFVLFYVPAGKRQTVRERLEGLVEVDFTIGSEGSKIVLYEPNGL